MAAGVHHCSHIKQSNLAHEDRMNADTVHRSHPVLSLVCRVSSLSRRECTACDALRGPRSGAFLVDLHVLV